MNERTNEYLSKTYQHILLLDTCFEKHVKIMKGWVGIGWANGWATQMVLHVPRTAISEYKARFFVWHQEQVLKQCNDSEICMI
jgi:hypothetical protein